MGLFKRKPKEQELKACPRCRDLIAADALDCPSCGLDLREAYDPPADELRVARQAQPTRE